MPMTEATRPMTSASMSTVLMIWRRDAPIVRSGGELPRPLRNRDRERVRDHERADEQRDAAEGEQEALEEAEEALRLARILVGLTFSGAYLGAGRQDGLIAETSSASVVPSDAAARIWSSLPSLLNSCCAVGRSNAASVAPPMLPSAREVEEPRHAQSLRTGPPPGRRSCSPTSMSFLDAVDVSTATSLRPGQVALLEHERVEASLGGVDREADVRRAAELDHVAVVVDQLRLSADAAHSGVDFGQRLHLRPAETRRTRGSRHPSPRSRRRRCRP